MPLRWARCSCEYAGRREETASVLQYDTSWIGKEFDRYAYNVTRSYSVGYK